jgi:hypothetical protein
MSAPINRADDHPGNAPLSHARLDVYRCAIEFLAFAVSILSSLPKGNADLADQLRRASLSITLNIADAIVS